MNSVNINLLSTSGGNHDKDKRLKRVRVIATGFILFVGLLSIVGFILNISSPLGGIKAQENDVLAQITAQQDKAAKLGIVNERVVTISKIYSKRPDYNDIVGMVLSKATGDVNSTGLDIGESAITVSVSSTSLLSLNNFLDAVIDESKKNSKIQSVFLDNLSVTQTSSSYVMGIKINVK